MGLSWERKDEWKNLILVRSLLYACKKYELIKARPESRMSPVTAGVRAGYDCVSRWLCGLLCASLRRLALKIHLIFVNKLLLGGGGLEVVVGGVCRTGHYSTKEYICISWNGILFLMTLSVISEVPQNLCASDIIGIPHLFFFFFDF